MQENHKRFADKYFETLNGAESARYAGYAESSARIEASRLLDREDVQQYLQQLRSEYAEKSGITKEWVIKRFEHISDACVTAKPVMQWDKESKSYIPVTDENGNPVYQFDSSGANKATEMLGKIIGVFEKDNQQKTPDAPPSPIVNVYSSAPPLADSEAAVDA